MAIAVLFTPKSMKASQYDEVIKRLEKAGAAAPTGRLYHACFGNSNQLHVFDVWDSMEQFQKFGETLVPIMKELGAVTRPTKPSDESWIKNADSAGMWLMCGSYVSVDYVISTLAAS